MSTAALVFPFPKGTAYNAGALDQGWDISAPAHTPELAVESGVVSYRSMSGFGDHVPILRGDSGRTYYYGHAGPGGEVTPGTRVKAGQQIGEVGAGIVGISTGPHLEIGVATASGAPAGAQTAAGLKAALSSGAKVSQTHHRSLLNQILTGPFTDNSASGKILQGGNPVGDTVSLAVKAVFSGAWDWLKAHALKGAMTAMFVVMGAVLVAYGIAKMFGVSPTSIAGKLPVARMAEAAAL